MAKPTILIEEMIDSLQLMPGQGDPPARALTPKPEVPYQKADPLDKRVDSLNPIPEQDGLPARTSTPKPAIPPLPIITIQPPSPKSPTRPLPPKFDISILPSTIIERLCTHIDTPTLFSLRSTNRALQKKTHPAFSQLFSIVKIALTPRSLGILEHLSADAEIAEKITHITIGTETLDQYKPYMNEMRERLGDTDEVHEYTRQFAAGVAEEDDARSLMAEALQACLGRMPNLKSVKIEDRPVLGSSGDKSEYRSFLGSAHLERLTDVEFAWNGPFGEGFPKWSRQYTFIAVFIALRHLRILGREVCLDILLGGYVKSEAEAEGQGDGERETAFCVPFDASKRMGRDAMAKDLRKLEFRDLETELEWVRGLESVSAALIRS